MGIQMSRRKYRSRTLQQPHLTSMSTQNYCDEELDDPHLKVHMYVYIYLPISIINVNLLSEQPLNMNHKLSRFTYQSGPFNIECYVSECAYVTKQPVLGESSQPTPRVVFVTTSYGWPKNYSFTFCVLYQKHSLPLSLYNESMLQNSHTNRFRECRLLLKQRAVQITKASFRILVLIETQGKDCNRTHSSEEGRRGQEIKCNIPAKSLYRDVSNEILATAMCKVERVCIACVVSVLGRSQ